MRKFSPQIAFAFLLGSCVYHDFPMITWGRWEAKMNNSTWDLGRYPEGHQNVSAAHYGPFLPCTTEYYNVGSELLNKDGFERESIFMELAAIPPGSTGRFKIIRRPSNGELPCVNKPLVTSRFFTIAQDGDVVQDVFDVTESEDNYIVIHSFDPKILEITGTFQVTFVVTDRSIEQSSLPDTLRFTQGRFETMILH